MYTQEYSANWSVFGPKAPKRKRPKRIAKKIARRGGMLRTRGLIQDYHLRWPEIARWAAFRAHVRTSTPGAIWGLL